jgi:intracellular multiplication protein IcmC
MNTNQIYFKTMLKAMMTSLMLIIAVNAKAAGLNAATILENFALTVPELMRLVTATGYVLGMFLIFRGITELKQFGESRTMMSREHSLKVPLVSIFVGTVLLYLPSSVQASLATFWTEPTPYAYITDSKDSWSSVYTSAYMVIGLIGTVAFIRGVLMLNQTSGHGQPGAFMKSMTHIIAGTFCINLYQFIQMLSLTLGIESI